MHPATMLHTPFGSKSIIYLDLGLINHLYPAKLLDDFSLIWIYINF